MATDLIERDAVELIKAERKVHEAEGRALEAFYYVGMALKDIKQKEPFKAAGYKSWEAYCKSGRLSYSKRQANTYIRVAKFRILLPDLKKVGGHPPESWTIQAVEQLARLELDQDVKRVAGKVRTKIKNGELLTTSLIKGMVDKDMGIERDRKEKKAKEMPELPTFAETLEEQTETLKDWITSWGKVPVEWWDEAESESPGIVKRLTLALEDAASYLKE